MDGPRQGLMRVGSFVYSFWTQVLKGARGIFELEKFPLFDKRLLRLLFLSLLEYDQESALHHLYGEATTEEAATAIPVPQYIHRGRLLLHPLHHSVLGRIPDLRLRPSIASDSQREPGHPRQRYKCTMARIVTLACHERNALDLCTSI